MKLAIKSISKNFPKWLDVNVYPPTVLGVKKTIQTVTSTPSFSDINIYYNGDLLGENDSLRKYGIVDGAVLGFTIKMISTVS